MLKRKGNKTAAAGKPRAYSDEIKNQARQMLQTKVPGPEITKRLKLGKYTLADWRKLWLKEGSLGRGKSSVPAKAAAAPAKPPAMPTAKPAAKPAAKTAAKPAVGGELAQLKGQVASLTAALKELVPSGQLLQYKARLKAQAAEAVAKAKAAQSL